MKVNLGQGINVTRKQMTAMASPLSAINPHKYGAGTRLSSLTGATLSPLSEPSAPSRTLTSPGKIG